MSVTLPQWTDRTTGLVHLVEEDQGWVALYCTWQTLEIYLHELRVGVVPTCLRCIALAVKDGRCWDAGTEHRDIGRSYEGSYAGVVST